MPIVSRSLSSVQPSAGGTVLVMEEAIDALGRSPPWIRGRRRSANEAQAIIEMDAYDWTPQLKDADFADLLVWVQAPAKNDPGTFDLTGRDISLLEGEDFLYEYFAESVGEVAILLAWWLKAMNPPTISAIRIRAGLNVEDGDRVQDRAIALDDAEATFNDTVEID